MSRIYTSASDPIDFCVLCFPYPLEAQEQYGNVGSGPDGRENCFSYDAEHPAYEDETIHCHECGKLLGEEDN